LRERDAWAEPGNASITKIRAIAELLRRVVQRFPQFVVAAEVVEFRRHDADDFSVVAVQADFAVEDTGIAPETPLPERVAQHGGGGGALRIELLCFREGAADQWPNAERVKQAGSSAGAADALWLVFTSQIEIGDKAGEGQIGEDLLTAPPIEVVGRAGWGFGGYGVRQAGGNSDEAVRGRIRKVTDEDAIGDRKDTGARCASKP